MTLANLGTINTTTPLATDGWHVVYDDLRTSAATTFTASGLAGNTDIEYMIIQKIKAGSASSTNYLVRINADASTVYGYRYINAASSTVSTAAAVNQTSIIMGQTTSGTYNFCTMKMNATTAQTTNRLTTVNNGRKISGETVTQMIELHYVYNESSTELTSLEFTATQTDGYGAGTQTTIWAKY